MKIAIETPDDALACVVALQSWLVQSLARAGYLCPHQGEDGFYTRRRELADKLLAHIKENRPTS